jgi:histidinol-phosphate phosphatase family protein
MNLADLKIDRNWSLFLDRDGVINRRIVGGYVKTWDEMGFLPGVLDAIASFSNIFNRIFVVSNQQGVGKGLMTMDEVINIHHLMVSEINKAGGRIDGVYFCPNLESDRSIMRKPNIGMALRARREFPEIRFNRSLMVGDSLSDMIFGKRTGMKTALIASSPELAQKFPHFIDYLFPDLRTLSLSLASNLLTTNATSP